MDNSQPVSKMHGCGNDFVVYVDLDEQTTPEEVKKMCASHTGVGADGVIAVIKSRVPEAKYRMKYFNADGSVGQMCGNGIRCFAKYLVDNGLVTEGKIPVDTDAGMIVPEVLENTPREAIVKVNMGRPILQDIKQVTLPADKDGLVHVPFQKLTGTYIGMGNPHVIFFVEKGKAEQYVKEYGSQIEHMTATFPTKTNVEFVEINNRKDLTMHVWERAVGLTLACGTGACATLVAAVLQGFAETQAKVHLPGGTLEISWEGKDAPVFMTGPATNVFNIQNLQELLLDAKKTKKPLG